MPAPTSHSRYHRQELLPGVGETGQARLASSHAMLIGCGALGCSVADLLARAGVGRISIIDRDIVELTNLQRQCLFDETDVRESPPPPKAEAARRRIAKINSAIVVQAIVEDFSPDNAEALVRPHPMPTVLIDCADNFETRYLANDVAVKLAIPLVYGGAVGTSGMGMVILPPLPSSPGTATPCLRCLFPEPPPAGFAPTCDTAGILGPAAAITAANQAAEAIKIMLGRRESVATTLQSFDLWSNQSRRLDLASARRPDCPCCGERRFEFLDGRYAGGTTVLCGRSSVQVTPSRRSGERTAIDLAELAARLARHGEVAVGEHSLRAKVTSGEEPFELTIFRDGRAVVGGTIDPAIARSIYARYVGA